jgi:hypothetical protein
LFCKFLIEKFLKDVGWCSFGLESLPDPVDHYLIGFTFPNAVAAHDDELKTFSLAFDDIGRGDDDLLVGFEVLITFELQVAQGAGNVEGVVDSAAGDEASCLFDAGVFVAILRFVVKTEGHGTTVSIGNAT